MGIHQFYIKEHIGYIHEHLTTKLHFIGRRQLEYGLLQDPSEITDQDLTSFVQEVKQTDTHCGMQMMC